MSTQPNRVFVSYTHDDSVHALKLARDLKTARVNVWLDQRDIPPGTRWDQTIQEALDQSSCLIVILSSRSVASQNVMDEVSYAIDEKIDILPVLIEHCKVPLRLRRFQFIDFTDDYSAALKKLLRLLRAIPERAKPAADQTNSTLPARKDLKRTAIRSDARKGWRSELISKGWLERSIRVFLTHDTHVIDVRVHLSKGVTVVRLDGVACVTRPYKEGLAKFTFPLADGPQKHSTTIKISRSFWTEQIKGCSLTVDGRVLYSE